MIVAAVIVSIMIISISIITLTSGITTAVGRRFLGVRASVIGCCAGHEKIRADRGC